MTRLALFSVLSAALATGVEPSVSLNGEWRFQLARTAADAERLARFFEPGFDVSGFRPIAVPSNWALQGFEEPMYSTLKSAGEGFYLHRFQTPTGGAGKRVLLHFGGVWASAEVWLNGKALGRHDSGFTSFAFDASKAIRASGENLLAVRVRQITHDYEYDVNDDWSLGGIYRDVWLEWTPADTWIDRVEATTRFDAQYRDADLEIRALVMQAKSTTSNYELRAVLAGPNGREMQRAAVSIPTHAKTGRDTILRMNVIAPAPWTAETPNLYRLRVELAVNGAVIHAREHAVGFREVSTKGGVLRINGRPVKLRGVDRHDENPDVGRATRHEHWIEDIRLMKAANINFIRTSHYPPAEGFIKLCDELGMYVLDEVPMGKGGDDAADPSMTAGALLRAHETIARDRNHPSVIIWSIGNEDPLTATHLAVIRAVKGTDPTRPVLMPWRAESWLPEEIDILAPHYKSAAEYDAMVANSSRPVLTTEYTHALGEDGFGGLEDRWRALVRHAAGAGGAIWMWQDQGLRVNGRLRLDRRGIDGIVDSERKPQRDYWEARAVYAPVETPPAIILFPGARSVVVPVRNEFDFIDLETVRVRWQVFGNARPLASGEARVKAAPHTSGNLNLDLGAAAQPRQGVSYYAHLKFLRPDDSEIVTRSVELVSGLPVRATVPGTGGLKLRERKTLLISAGSVTYEFDPATAQLVSVSANGRKLLNGARLTIWRKLNETEASLYERDKLSSKALPDLDRYTTTVRNWTVRHDGAAYMIEAEAEHRVNEKNSFLAGYRFRAARDGTLEVRYTVHPRIEARWLPETGVELSADPSFGHMRWLGLGPLDGYPNEHAACIFGLWSTEAGGTKSGVRWAELSDGAHAGFRITGAPYVRLEAPGRLRALAAVVGRPEKNRRPSEPEYRLDITPDAEFTGGFTLSPTEPE